MDWFAVRMLQACAWLWFGGSIAYAILEWFGIVTTTDQSVLASGILYTRLISSAVVIVQGILIWALMLCVASITDYCLWRRHSGPGPGVPMR